MLNNRLMVPWTNMIHINISWLTRFNRMLKRTLDIFVSLSLLVILLPLFIYLMIKISRDGGPALYGHLRVGMSGKKFKCYKFRSMVTNSQQVLTQILATDPQAQAEWHKNVKLKNDPRITQLGHFMRRTSIDELPQLWNVLKGEMSLVGPRPVTADELIRYRQYRKYYLAVRPGITGLWQMSGRNDLSYRERVRLDIRYIIRWSFLKDVIILAKTVYVVLFRKGAY